MAAFRRGLRSLRECRFSGIHRLLHMLKPPNCIFNIIPVIEIEEPHGPPGQKNKILMPPAWLESLIIATIMSHVRAQAAVCLRGGVFHSSAPWAN